MGWLEAGVRTYVSFLRQIIYVDLAKMLHVTAWAIAGVRTHTQQLQWQRPRKKKMSKHAYLKTKFSKTQVLDTCREELPPGCFSSFPQSFPFPQPRIGGVQRPTAPACDAGRSIKPSFLFTFAVPAAVTEVAMEGEASASSLSSKGCLCLG